MSAANECIEESHVDNESVVIVNRPIVCAAKGVRLCRPSEVVLDLLDRMPPGPYRKEDGELLIDDQGRRV